MERLRIGLTISGAVSLGAYEGGALAALLVAIKKLGERVPGETALDVIAGASAGSMTGVLAARALLTDADPVQLMYRAWVTAPSLRRMRGHGVSAPLSVDSVHEMARSLLGESCPSGPGTPQQTPVRLQLALGALRGLEYRFRRLRGPDLEATTYLDWYLLEFTSNDDPDAYIKAIDPALASGAHAAAFPPRGLSRADARAEYVDNGVVNFPETDYLWYTDGGTIDNQPLGRALDMAKELDTGFAGNRLHLLIIPEPSFGVSADVPKWADPGRQPVWIQTLARAGKMAIAQSLYDDLRHAEKVNSRLNWSEQLANTLAGHLGAGAAPELAELIAHIDGQRSEALGANSSLPPAPPGADDSLEELLRRAIMTAAGLHKKQATAVDAISPRLLGADAPADVDRLLAGRFLGHFGGFLDRRFRRSDFALGYRCMLAWLEDPARGLTAYGLAAADVEEATAAAAAARLDGRWTAEGGATLARLGPAAWWQLGLVAARVLRVTLSGLRNWARDQRSSTP